MSSKLVIFALSVILCSSGGMAADRKVPPGFANPPSTYRPSPFWSWNSALDDAELRWQVREFKDKGFGGYFMHPRVGLVTPYLSEEWFHKIRVCLEEGRKAGLESWLYDEDKWPSGFAGGLATHDKPEFVARGMGWMEIIPREIESALADPETIAVFELTADGFRRLEEKAGEPAGRVVRFFSQPYEKSNWFNGEAYIDVLNPDAIAYFLKLTFLDGYNPRFGKDYGPAMPGVFTDEPNFQSGRGRDRTVFPWTGRLPAEFQKARGYDLVGKLPLLTEGLPGYQQVRYDFWRTVTEMFETAFSKQYGELTGKAGLKFTGHYLAEDTLSAQTNVAGSVMVHYLHQHVPGIDHLQRNIRNPLTKKQASSIADQFGRDRVLSELFGVSGHTMTFEDLKWLGDNHYVLGVNMFAPHLTLYSMAGDRKRDYPPTFSYHQPYWSELKMVNDYFGRAGYFVTRGKPQKRLLLLEPLGSVWAHFLPGARQQDPEVAAQEQSFQEVFDSLLGLHRDFDLGDEMVLERFGKVEGQQLRVGPEGRYQVVVVPPAERWNETTVSLLSAFSNAGGKVVIVGLQPRALAGLAGKGVVRAETGKENLEQALAPVMPRDISIRDASGAEVADILYAHRRDSERDYFFLVNSSRAKSYRVSIRLDPELTGKALEEWDLQTGRIVPGSLEQEIQPAGSVAFAVERARAAGSRRLPPGPADKPVRTEIVSGPFSFSRTHPNTLVLDFCRYSLNGSAEEGPVPVWKVRQATFNAAGLREYVGIQPWAMEWKGIKPDKTAQLRMRFEFESELETPRAWLVVEKGQDFAITVNGQVAPKPDGWHWDKQFTRIPVSSLIRKGINRVELTTEYRSGVEIEDVFVIGDFATRKVNDTKYVMVSEPDQLALGDWTGQGYHFYSGNMIYRMPVTHSGQPVSLKLDRPQGTAFVVRANGKEVKTLGWAPFEADLTPALKAGQNQVEIVVLGSLQNSFGPLHNKRYYDQGNDWWIGPNAFADLQQWIDSYYLAPYGLQSIELQYGAKATD